MRKISQSYVLLTTSTACVLLNHSLLDIGALSWGLKDVNVLGSGRFWGKP